jgi:hypothetical protein
VDRSSATHISRPGTPEEAWEWLREAIAQLRDSGYVGTADEAESALSVLWLAYEGAAR